jgi:phosphatidylglycerol---prolipoprotein diacylglyceryl transferase
MQIAFQIGPFAVHWYGIMITLGIVAAISISMIEAKRRGESLENVVSLALVILPLGIIGARLYHVIDQWSYYSQHLLQIFGGQGLGIYGAIFGGLIGLVIFTRLKKLSTLRWLDIVAPGLILAQAIGRWGNYFNQELYGYPTDLPWGIYIDPAHRLPGFEAYSHFQPLFLYESLLNLLGFALLMVLGRKLKHRLLDGDIFFIYLIHYSVVRFILEGFKISVWTLGGFPTARWIAIAGGVISLAIMIYRHSRRRAIQAGTGL